MSSSAAGGAVTKLWSITEAGSQALMIGLGYETGLFQAFTDRDNAAMTLSELASAAKVHERYAKEWTAAMVCAGLLTFDASAQQFQLEAGLAEHLETSGYAALQWTRAVAGLAGTLPRLKQAFHEGGGVGYDEHGAFYEVLATGRATNKQWAEAMMGWLKQAKTAYERLEAGEALRVLEIGCGHGKTLRVFAAAYPAATFIGLDLSEAALAEAREAAAEEGLTNVTFKQADLTQEFEEAESCDVVLAQDVMHDLPHLAPVLANVRRVLRPSGCMLANDIGFSSNLEDNVDKPMASLYYSMSTMHCLTTSMAQAPDSDALGSMWGVQRACEFLKEAGFATIEQYPEGTDITYVCYLE